MSPEESRSVALAAARELLIESGPRSVTLKAVAGRIGRTHANLLHHFGSAAGLQRELAAHLSQTICGTIAQAVLKFHSGEGSAREVVDLTFDAFGDSGGGALASWMLLNGNEDALNPVIDAIHQMVEDIEVVDTIRREITLTLVLLALGDSLMGAPLSRSLGLPRGQARDGAERMLLDLLAGKGAG